MFSILSIILGVIVSGVAATPGVCGNLGLSCQSTVATDTCCYNNPGGQLLLTQFWNYSPAFGPTNKWTIHGVWPDKCDGTYESYCDSSRAYTGALATLNTAGESDLIADLQTYWKDNTGDDPGFWEYEWEKHGTCISTLKPSCYTSYTAREEFIDYLQLAIDLNKSRDSYAFLAAAGIVPSSSKTYSAASIQAALTAGHGGAVTIRCSSSALSEIWYSYNVRGSAQTGEWVAVSPTGTTSNCSGNIYYRPKVSGTAIGGTPTATATKTTTATTATGTTTAPTSTATGVVTGTGYLQVTTSGTSKGCLISAGTWYLGTCATYTATASGSGFKLASSKGNCAIVSGAFTCASGTTAGIFNVIGGQLVASGSSTTWYATAIVSGSTQLSLYSTTASGRTTPVVATWQAL